MTHKTPKCVKSDVEPKNGREKLRRHTHTHTHFTSKDWVGNIINHETYWLAL